MNSLRQHFERMQAEKAARAKVADPRLSAQGRPLGQTLTRQNQPVQDGESSDSAADASNIELKFFNDWEQLSGIQSRSKKDELKTELLPHYQPYIDGTLSAGVGEQNDMLLKLMVWSLDTQNLITATNIAEFALLNGMVMPEPFTRDVATVFAEQFSDELLKRDATTDADLVQRAIDITSGHDMPDQVRAKLYRVLGDSLKTDHAADAIGAYEKALKLDPAAGCKTDLAQLKKTADKAD